MRDRVGCPECGVLRGQMCLGSRGKERHGNHQARVNTAHESPVPWAIHAHILLIMVFDFADWNGKLWELSNRGYTPKQVCDALNALNLLAGKPAEQTIEDCTPR